MCVKGVDSRIKFCKKTPNNSFYKIFDNLILMCDSAFGNIFMQIYLFINLELKSIGILFFRHILAAAYLFKLERSTIII